MTITAYSNLNAELLHAADEAMHCEAFNAAFYELGLKWYWNVSMYKKLQPDAPGMKERMRAYLELEHPHLLKAYQPEFLVQAILDAKARCLSAKLSCGCTGLLGEKWATMQIAQVGI